MTHELKLLLALTSLGILLVLGLKYLFPFFAPFILGVAFAALSEPLVRLVETKLRLQRRIAVSLVLIALILAVAGIVTVTVVVSYREMERLLPRAPLLVHRMLAITASLRRFLGDRIPGFDVLSQGLTLDSETVNQIVKSVLNRFMLLMKEIPQLFMAIGLGGISAYFFSRDKNTLSPMLYRLTPPDWRLLLFQIKTEMTETVSKFIRAECALVSLTCILTVVIFKALGIPGALAYGLLAGMLDFLPVVGPGLIYLPLAAIYGAFGGYMVAGGIIGGYLAVILVRQVAEFRLVGGNLNVHPLWTLFTIYLGMKLFGMAGIFFGPVIVITLRAFYQAFHDQEVFT